MTPKYINKMSLNNSVPTLFGGAFCVRHFLLLYLDSIILLEFISRKTVDFEMSDDGLDSDEIILEGKKET